MKAMDIIQKFQKLGNIHKTSHKLGSFEPFIHRPSRVPSAFASFKDFLAVFSCEILTAKGKKS